MDFMWTGLLWIAGILVVLMILSAFVNMLRRRRWFTMDEMVRKVGHSWKEYLDRPFVWLEVREPANGAVTSLAFEIIPLTCGQRHAHAEWQYAMGDLAPSQFVMPDISARVLWVSADSDLAVNQAIGFGRNMRKRNLEYRILGRRSRKHHIFHDINASQWATRQATT